MGNGRIVWQLYCCQYFKMALVALQQQRLCMGHDWRFDSCAYFALCAGGKYGFAAVLFPHNSCFFNRWLYLGHLFGASYRHRSVEKILCKNATMGILETHQ